MRSVRLLTGDARQAVFAPLDDGAGRSEAVARRLGSAIALGIVEDGEQLPSEAQLAASLGVAPTTLREALADLRDRGLVTTRRGRGGGSFVNADPVALADVARDRLRDLGSVDLRELGDLRSAVGGTAARLAATRASSADINTMRALLDRLAEAGDPYDQRRLEARHVIAVAAAAQSVRLTRQEIELQAELGQLAAATTRSADFLAYAVTVRRSVVDAIAAREPELARSRTEDLIEEETVALIEAHLRLTRAGGAKRDGVESPSRNAASAQSAD